MPAPTTTQPLTEVQVEDLRSIVTNIVESAVNVQHLLRAGFAGSTVIDDHIATLSGSTALLEDLAHEVSGCVLMFGHPEECVR